MAPPLLTLEDIRLKIGGTPLFEGAGLSIEPRARIALVGRNGAGKSTLLKIAAGLVEADSGGRYVDPGARIAYLAQEPDLAGYDTVGAYAEAGLDAVTGEHRAARLLAELGLDPDTPTANLSGGEARRAAIAHALASDPEILLLDEPTNHLDLPAIAWLEERIAASRAGIVIISHDRRFLETLTRETLWVDRGATRQIAKGFSEFEAWRDKFLEEEEAARHKLDRKIAMEEDWVRYGVTARRKRNVRRMRELGDLRKARRDARRQLGEVAFSVSEAAPSGKRVIVAENISKSFGGRTIVSGFSIEIGRGDRVGFVGPNGAGKTTLLKLLTGALAPDSGAIRLGANLDIISLDQRRAALDLNARVADAITDGRGDWVIVNGEKRHAASYLKDFLFTPEQFRAPVNALSGGERARLALAAALAKPSNLLVLDEPTNDLDLETLDLLEEMLGAYKGALLLVSHDRSFVDHIVTSIVAPAPEGSPGEWIEYVGGYDDLVAQRGGAPGLERRAKKWIPVFRKTGATKEESTASDDADLLPDAVGAPAKEAARKPAPPLARAAPASSKLSYREKFALEQLPGRIAALGEEIASLQKKLADPAFYDRDPAAFSRAAADLDKAEAALAGAEDEWLALEMKREALEG